MILIMVRGGFVQRCGSLRMPCIGNLQGFQGRIQGVVEGFVQFWNGELYGMGNKDLQVCRLKLLYRGSPQKRDPDKG